MSFEIEYLSCREAKLQMLIYWMIHTFYLMPILPSVWTNLCLCAHCVNIGCCDLHSMGLPPQPPPPHPLWNPSPPLHSAFGGEGGGGCDLPQRCRVPKAPNTIFPLVTIVIVLEWSGLGPHVRRGGSFSNCSPPGVGGTTSHSGG